VAQVKPPFNRKRFYIRLGIVALIAAVGSLVVLPLVLGLLSIYGLTHPPCSDGGNPSFNLNSETIQFRSTHGLVIEGYWIPGMNGATIIHPPAYSSGRASELEYTQVFNDAGFNVLRFESRSCTDHPWHSLGYLEAEDVAAAVEYLRKRGDVDLSRIGIWGFSSAGATSTMAAAEVPALKAVVAAGGYHDFAAGLVNEHPISRLFAWGNAAGYRLITGLDISGLRPIDAATALTPDQHLLLVYGSTEVTLDGARQTLEAAQAMGVDARLWVVEGAGHGDYLDVQATEFNEVVVGFFQEHLGGSI
jgi:pimeloyl-ACP methyl ester carboxylesterase